MPLSPGTSPLRWRSYWQRPAAAIAVPDAAALTQLRARVRESGFGQVRLQAQRADVPEEGTTLLLMVGAPDPAAHARVEAAARGLARRHGAAWILLPPGDDVAARLDALVRLVL